MNFAFIKNKICFNIGVFDDLEMANAFKEAMVRDGLCDDIIEYNGEFAIGDIYENGIWSTPEPQIDEKLTTEQELELLQQKVLQQDMIIEELMFVIIPEMMGGGI